ncbi:MAG: M3 family metallopeptidase [Gammaproteobacteria bacterium]|nr:M3 family metallopeptidase [Gammaproteobacteria bacterium]
MEHWAFEPAVMKSFARHEIPMSRYADDLVDKILATETFNQGFATTEYLAASYLDMRLAPGGCRQIRRCECGRRRGHGRNRPGR